MLFARNRPEVSFNLIVLLKYLTVLLEYIDVLSMLHDICIGGLAPFKTFKGAVSLGSVAIDYNNIMYTQGHYSMVITGRL